MKIRNGFVSNSSSSSFIVGLAEIQDIDKLRKSLSEKDKGVYIVSRTDLLEANIPCGYELNVELKNNNLIAKSFNDQSVSLKWNDTVEYWLLVTFVGDEGDGHFLPNEGYDPWDCQPNYDITESFFSKEQQRLLEVLKNPREHGLKDAKYIFGAERNG